jgi:hypothetical protein
MAGQEGIPSVFSPMARTLNDLTYFTRAIVGMEPWKYDYTVHPISWRENLAANAQGRSLRVGLMSSDGMFCLRRFVSIVLTGSKRRSASYSGH